MTDTEIVRLPALQTRAQGRVCKVHVVVGEPVSPGTVIATVEVNKAEYAVRARHHGFVVAVLVEDGQEVREGSPLVEIEPDALGLEPADTGPNPSALAADDDA